MRILHLTDRRTDRGGAHWYLIGVLHALRDAGHAVHLAAGIDEGRPRAECPVTVVPGLESRTRRPLGSSLDTMVQAFQPDLVHLHTIVNPAVLEWAAERRAVLTVQDHRYFCPARGKWTAAGEPCRETLAPKACASCFEDDGYFREVHALTQERLAAVRRLPLTVLSHYMKAELVSAGVPAHAVEVVRPFVHGLDGHAPPDGPPCVLFVGRLSAAKGALDAVEAWKRSAVRLPLVVAGTGPLRSEVEAAGAEVLGWVDRDGLARLYRRARAVLMPSRWQEPFGLAGLEALTLGAPVVAWDSGGIGEWHPGPLVGWGDVDGLARALRETVETGGRAPGPRGGFTVDASMVRLLAVYRACLGRHHARAEVLGA